jgi:muconolactone delta-isomerase
MKILALEHETSLAEIADLQELLKSEAGQVWRLQQAGFVREVYFETGRDRAVLILESPTIEQARETLSHLPLVKAGRIEFELLGLRAYPGFERLFERGRS